MPDRTEVRKASTLLLKHAGPWEKGLHTPTGSLRVGLANALRKGEIPADSLAAAVERIRAIKKIRGDYPLEPVAAAAETALFSHGANHALATLHSSLDHVLTRLQREAPAIDAYKRAGFKHSDLLRTRSGEAFTRFAEALRKDEISRARFKELGSMVAKLDERGIERFSRRVLSAEDTMRLRGAARGFEQLLTETRLLLPAESPEDEFFRAGERAERAIAGGARRSEETVMFDLKKLREEEEAARAEEQVGNFDIEKFERRAEKMRRAKEAFKALPRRALSAFKRNLSEAAGRSPVAGAFSRLKQRFSKKPFTIVHPKNKLVSQRHARLIFDPSPLAVFGTTVTLQDRHATNAPEHGTFVMPGKSKKLPAELGPGINLKHKKDVAKVSGRTVRLLQGNEFKIGENVFRLHRASVSEVVLKGVRGPVNGKVFRFNPRQQREVLIGRHPDNHIQLFETR